MNVDRYLPESHQPHALPLSEVYADAVGELAQPYPSTRLGRFKAFDQMTGGFRAHEYTILCGGTGTGKTTFCANLSQEFTAQGVPHFVASVETGHTDFVKRAMSAFAGMDMNTGEVVNVDYLKSFHVNHGGRFQSDALWLSLYDNRIPVESLMADLAWMVKNKGTKVAFIDNLNFLMDVKSAGEAIMEMDRVTHELVIFVKQVPIHIVMVMHPKKTENWKNPELSGRVESEFDIKGSSTAVQEAHNILLWNRPHPKLIEQGVATQYDRELKIAKMRRRGKYVGKRIIFKGVDGTRYEEGVIV